MMEDQILTYFAQFGMAGMMGLLWIIERRLSSQRERELTEAHAKIVEQQGAVSELIAVVRENTAALAGLQNQQSHLSQVCDEIVAFLRTQRLSGRSQMESGPDL